MGVRLARPEVPPHPHQSSVFPTQFPSLSDLPITGMSSDTSCPTAFPGPGVAFPPSENRLWLLCHRNVPRALPLCPEGLFLPVLSSGNQHLLCHFFRSPYHTHRSAVTRNGDTLEREPAQYLGAKELLFLCSCIRSSSAPSQVYCDSHCQVHLHPCHGGQGLRPPQDTLLPCSTFTSVLPEEHA